MALRNKSLTLELHINSRLDKNLWLSLGAIRPVFFYKKGFIENLFPTRLSRINALSETNL